MKYTTHIILFKRATNRTNRKILFWLFCLMKSLLSNIIINKKVLKFISVHAVLVVCSSSSCSSNKMILFGLFCLKILSCQATTLPRSPAHSSWEQKQECHTQLHLKKPMHVDSCTCQQHPPNVLFGACSCSVHTALVSMGSCSREQLRQATPSVH